MYTLYVDGQTDRRGLNNSKTCSRDIERYKIYRLNIYKNIMQIFFYYLKSNVKITFCKRNIHENNTNLHV